MSDVEPRKTPVSPMLWLAEALLTVPALIISIYWVVLIVLGLMHSVELQTHNQLIERGMTFLLIAALVCFPVGAIIFIVAPKRS